ncbi:hypothetical protein [Nocardia vulneris]|uniref:Uncharacterized protein n=1 Tax=Nocardia vulneris TaxID=1141657 RepID=A0ABR4ZMA9_9NOCA|nr:hypothetical protein [Nocardia vulneris]KIA66430.1 hypothetical protein FG87_02275 [Nocardia vulneris]
MSKTEYSALHFSQANPRGAAQGDVPALLRRIAATLEELGAVSVQDLVLHNEVTAEGDWPSVTVYYTRTDGDD